MFSCTNLPELKLACILSVCFQLFERDQINSTLILYNSTQQISLNLIIIKSFVIIITIAQLQRFSSLLFSSLSFAHNCRIIYS